MATATIVGVFEDEAAAEAALTELQRAGFRQGQLGVLARGNHGEKGSISDIADEGQQSTHRGPGALARGLLGGIMGAIDILLLPVTGPADASLILGSTLPIAEEALDRLPYPGSRHDEAAHARPDAPMTVQDKAVGEQTQPSRTLQEAVELPSLEEAETDSDTATVADTQDERGSVVTGGVIGGLLGAVAALFIPGVGPAIAGGIFASILSGAAVGSIAGGFLGAFTHIGVPEAKAHYYVDEFKAGRTIVTVRTDRNSQAALDVLHRLGARDVEMHG